MAHHLLVCGVGSGMENSLPEIFDLADRVTVIGDQFDTEIVQGRRVNYINCYPRDYEAVLHALKSCGVEDMTSTFTLGYENPLVIANLNEHYGLPGLSVEQAENCLLKDKRISLLSRAGVNTARFRVIRSLEEGMDFLATVDTGIVKPNDKTSSIGVSIIDKDSNAREAIESALAISASSIAVIEEHIQGTEHTFEGIVSEGNIYFTGISDRNYKEKYKFHPYIFENGDTLPSSLDAKHIAAIKREIEKGIVALGLDNSAFHCDILLSDKGVPYVLEIACRISGSRFGTEIVPLATGVKVLCNAVRLALCLPIDKDDFLALEKQRAVVLRYLPATEGYVEWIGNIKDVKDKVAGIYDAMWEQDLFIGKQLPIYKSGKDMLCSVIAYGEDIHEAEQNAVEALSHIPLIINSEKKVRAY